MNCLASQSLRFRLSLLLWLAIPLALAKRSQQRDGEQSLLQTQATSRKVALANLCESAVPTEFSQKVSDQFLLQRGCSSYRSLSLLQIKQQRETMAGMPMQKKEKYTKSLATAGATHQRCKRPDDCVILAVYRLGEPDPQRPEERSITKLNRHAGLMRWMSSIKRLESENVSGVLMLHIVGEADPFLKSTSPNAEWQVLVQKLLGIEVPQNIAVVSVNEFAPPLDQSNRQAFVDVQSDAVHKRAQRAVADIRSYMKQLSCNDWRLLVYRAWLLLNKDVTWVMFTDLTDVVVQHNPFPSLMAIGEIQGCHNDATLAAKACAFLPPIVSSEFEATKPDFWNDRPVTHGSLPGVNITSPAQYYQVLWSECYHWQNATTQAKRDTAAEVFGDRVYNVGLFGGHRQAMIRLLDAVDSDVRHYGGDDDRPNYSYCDMIFLQKGVNDLFGQNVLTGWPWHTRYGHFNPKFDAKAYIRHK